MGLTINANVLLAVVVLIPAALLFISLGLLCGSVFTDKQVGGVCGALLTNISAWLSGAWFDISMVGGTFSAIAKALPFVRAVDAAKYAIAGEYSKIMPELIWVIGYAVVLFALAIFVFTRKMNSDNT